MDKIWIETESGKVYGKTAGNVIPIRYAQMFVNRISDIRLETYESGGHRAAPKNAEDFAPIAVEFLKSLEAK